jgi:hypothetical protein
MRFINLFLSVTILFFSCKKVPDIFLDPKGPGTTTTHIDLNSSVNSVDSFIVDLRGRWTITTPTSGNWFKLSATVGNNRKKIYVTSTAENNSPQARSVNIELKSANRHVPGTTITISQKGKQWLLHKLVGGSNWDNFNGVLPIADGGFIAVGNTWSSDGDVPSNNGQVDMWIVRFSMAGDIVWSRTYGDIRWDAASKILKTPGGYAVLGSTVLEQDTEGNVGTPTLMKIDENGEQLWFKTFPLGTEVDLSGFSNTSSGGFICSGTANDEAVLIRLNDSGEEIWSRTYGGDKVDWAASVTQTTDGGFVATGRSGMPRIGTQDDWNAQDAWAFKVDENGNLIWSKKFGGSMNETGFLVDATNDGGAVLAARTESPDIEGFRGDQDIWLFKIDKDGNMQWQKPLGSAGSEQVSDLKVLPDGNIMLCSVARQAGGDIVQSFGGTDAWVVKLSGVGDIVWQQTIGGEEHESFSAMAIYQNKVYFAGSALGTTGEFSTNHGMLDGWVVVINQP